MEQFVQRPRAVIPELDNACRKAYPGLDKNPSYRRFLEYLLFSKWHCKYEPDSGRIVISQEIIWRIFNGARGNVSLHDILAGFERDMPINLNIQKHNREKRQATTIMPVIDGDVRRALQRNSLATADEKTAYLSVKKSVSKRKIRQDMKAVTIMAREEALHAIEELDPGSEKYRLLKILNGRGQRLIPRLIKSGIEKAKKYIGSLISENGNNYLDRIFNNIDDLENMPFIVYAPTESTERIHARLTNINRLPGTIRRLVLAYAAHDRQNECVEIDLAYTQLAVAAWRWELPKLTKELKKCKLTESSIWSVFLEYCNLDKNYKSIVKQVVYGLCYGMGIKKLESLFLEGTIKYGRRIPGIGDRLKWIKFRKHPIISELLRARKREIMNLLMEGGCNDAFGNYLCTSRDDGTLHVESILAVTAQSWEQNIMQAMVPILERNKQIYILSWLHDGLTIYFGDKTKKDRQLRNIIKAVESKASDLDILTHFEVEFLDIQTLCTEVRMNFTDQIIESDANDLDSAA